MSNHCRNCGQTVDKSCDHCRCGAPPAEGRSFCDACGNPTYADETQCVNCEHKLATGKASFSKTIVASNPPKDPGMIVAISIIPFPWLGQIFLGQTVKGITMLIVTWILSLLVIGIILIPFAAFDAYCLAKELQKGRSIGPWDFFWSIGKNQV